MPVSNSCRTYDIRCLLLILWNSLDVLIFYIIISSMEIHYPNPCCCKKTDFMNSEDSTLCTHSIVITTTSALAWIIVGGTYWETYISHRCFFSTNCTFCTDLGTHDFPPEAIRQRWCCVRQVRYIEIILDLVRLVCKYKINFEIIISQNHSMENGSRSFEINCFTLIPHFIQF